MRPPPFLHPPKVGQRSSVLIITLIFLSLITILILGFMSGAEIERSASHAYLEGIRADLLAQAGTDTAIAQLRGAIGTTNVGWVSQPGQLTVIYSNGAAVTNAVPLYSGVVASSDANNSLVAVNLNSPSLENAGSSSILPTNLPMSVQWLYLHSNGTVDSTTNNAVGRYAYWVDDESARINLNTAGTRVGNNNSSSDPSRIDLTALPGVTPSDVATVTSYRTNSTGHYFNSPAEVGQTNADVLTAVTQAPFSFTTYNHSPDLNMFGQPRIMLTTSRALAAANGTTNFIDVLTTDNTDPGSAANLSSTKVNALVAKLDGYLTRSDWPIAPGKSFQQKYPGFSGATATLDGVSQIAINIIDYVRCAESTSTLVDPIRGSTASGNFQLDSNASGGTALLGNTRRLCVVEMAAFVSNANPVVGTAYPAYFKCRLYLPPHWGIASTTVRSPNIYPTVSIEPSGGSTAFMASGTILSSEVDSDTISSGGYVTFKREISSSLVWQKNLSALIQIVIYSGIGGPHSEQAQVYYYPVGTNESSVNSMSVNDPCVNKFSTVASSGDWVLGTNNTFGTQNPTAANTKGLAPGPYSPPQDTDPGVLTNSEVLTDIGMQLPAPKNNGGPGCVLSLGELGFIHTGMDGYQLVGATKGGTPWRTLRLQPTSATDTSLPDWALLDLFSVPILPITSTATHAPFVLPGGYYPPLSSVTSSPSGTLYSAGGRINLNSQIAPFSLPASVRSLPVQALFLNATNNTTSGATNTAVMASALQLNVAQGTLAAGGRNFGNGLFYTPAQLAEIKGIADGGESSEALLQDTTGISTVNSGVFSIYSVGQAIQFGPAGNLLVLGERRYRTVIERVLSNNPAAPVEFLPVSKADITP